MASFPDVDESTKLDAAQLLLPHKMFQWTKILRGLQFIKTKLPNFDCEEELMYSVISLSQMVGLMMIFA